MTRQEALARKYETVILDGMSMTELRQLHGNISGWLGEWAGDANELTARNALRRVEEEINWRGYEPETVGV